MKKSYYTIVSFVILACQPAVNTKPNSGTDKIEIVTEKHLAKNDSAETKYKSESTNEESSYQADLPKINADDMPEIKRDLQVDSVAGKPIRFYLENPNLVVSAKRFYNGEIYPTDDSITFDLLDSLTTNNSELSPFYKLLFDYICDISDGALSEVMGQYGLNAMQTNTELYLRPAELKSFGYICYDLSFENDLDSKLKELCALWKVNTPLDLHRKVDALIKAIQEDVIERQKDF
ncbi:hypothetical protein [Mangrovibacterium diazotrophicum]|uniref:Lipoprotein n=1 Tax=Mangrovibacterium diazotrophicum TaxID=1261403 RepID=A0A419VXE6_9BACT|nr:hypothetical protein [Mangrovibacterium diazotrophicum]RKD87849.1 hypothetical protein BC643_3856 [Mangrovibacterium diazotrophicum]